MLRDMVSTSGNFSQTLAPTSRSFRQHYVVNAFNDPTPPWTHLQSANHSNGDPVCQNVRHATTKLKGYGTNCVNFKVIRNIVDEKIW